MAKQPEQILEEQLVEQLKKLNYSLVHFKNEKELITKTSKKSRIVENGFASKAICVTT
jgi:type I restriction enzyme, R subunit